MSSRKAAVKAIRRPAASARKPKPVPAPKATDGLSQEASRLAAELERARAADRLEALSPQAMQDLMGALCNLYAAQVEAGAKFTPIAEGQVVSPTGVMLTASGMLRAANLAVFELGMWQSWTGR
jgi:hypothetical protein